MRMQGAPSWSVSVGVFLGSVTHALAVREMADLPVYEAGIPEPLEPAPPALRFGLGAAARSEAGEQWRGWWSQVVAGWQGGDAMTDRPGVSPGGDPPKYASMTHIPALRQVLASTHEPLQSWWVEVNQQWSPALPWEQDLVAQLEARLARPVRPFSMSLDVLPVAGTGHWFLLQDVEALSIRAMVSRDVLTHPERHYGWILDALGSVA